MNLPQELTEAFARLECNSVNGLNASPHVRETFRDTITALCTGAQTQDDVNYARLLYRIAGRFASAPDRQVSPYHECADCIQEALDRVSGPPAEPVTWAIENRHRNTQSLSWTTLSSGHTKEEAWRRICKNRQTGHKSYEYRMVAVY